MSTVTTARLTPFKGLTPFDDNEQDALLFFGREREREIVVANLMASRLTVLYGPSGVGKTSLLRAGVAYGLREVTDAAVVVFSSWPGEPGIHLRETIAQAIGIPAGESLRETLEQASHAVGGDIYVILDQFEEYFLYHEQPHESSFGEEFAEAVGAPSLRGNFLIGVRDDALASLDAFKARIPGLFANSLRLDRLERAAGEAAIVGPVNAYNALVPPDERVEVEPALVEAILDEVAAGRVDLGRAGRGSVGGVNTRRIEAPYLQLVLERLWEVEAQAGSRRLRLETFRDLGGAARIVQNHLDRAMATLSPREQDAAAAMYHHLVTPSGTKIAHGVSDLAGYAAMGEEEAAAVLRRLSDERIVRAGENGGAGGYEIFHDVLADAVLAWRSRHESDRLLRAERVAADRRHRRLIRLTAAAVAAFGLVATVAVYALVERSNARHQAAAARVASVLAERQASIARAHQREAVRQKNAARVSRGKAQREATRAEAAQRNAQQAAAKARRSEAFALTQKTEARRQAEIATRASNDAAQSAARFRAERNTARLATVAAKRQKAIIHARELAADARASVVTDPEASLRSALTAVRAFRAARLRPGQGLEDVVRDGLLALRVRAVLPGGGGVVRAAEFSPDRSLVLVAGNGGARLFDRAHGLAVRRLLPATDLNTATFSPDGRLVAAGGGRKDRNVRVWDVQTGVLLYTLQHDGTVLSLAFSGNGKFLASGSEDGTARLWRVADGLPLPPIRHPAFGARGDDVRMVSFSPDSTRLLTVGGDRFARVFDAATQKQLLQLDNTTLVNAAHFSHDGRLIVTGGFGTFARIWGASSGQLQYAMRTTQATTGSLTEVVFSPQDDLLASVQDTTVKVWDLSTKSAVAILTVHRSGIDSVAFSPDGGSIVTAGRDGKAYVARTEFSFTQAVLLGHRGPVSTAAFSQNGREVVTASEDGTARIWDAEVDPNAPGPLGEPRRIGDHGLNIPVNAVAFSPDGRLALSAGDDSTARIWGPGNKVVLLKHDGYVRTASFSKDGKLVITGSMDGTVRVWRTADGTLVARLQHGEPVTSAVTAARLSPDGRLVLTAGTDGSTWLWAWRTGTRVPLLEHGAAVNDARFSPDGRLVVTASADGTAAIWSVADGHRLATLSGHRAAVVAAAFSPDGRRVATASADWTARIWNVASGESEHELAGHTGSLTSLAFSPNGVWLATGSSDNDARVWDVRSGSEVAVLRGHVNDVNDVAFSFDSRWLATAGPGSAGIWESRRKGTWAASPLYYSRTLRPVNDLAFSPRGWRIIFGSRDGVVRTFDCTLCGGIKQLTPLARVRLHEIVRAKS